MTPDRARLARLARLAHAVHAVTLLRLGTGLATTGASPRVGAAAHAVNAALGALALIAVAAGALTAARAGVERAALRLGGALTAWAGAAASADVFGHHAWSGAASLAVGLATIAWCALLGAAVRAAGGEDRPAFRVAAYAAMALHGAVQLFPSLLTSLGARGVAAVAIGATVLALGAATSDALRLDRATRAEAPPLGALGEPPARSPPDDPWRPGA